MIKAAYPSDDWGWALQWVNKNHILQDFSISTNQQIVLSEDV
jgi:hypothetical protein